MEYSVMATKKKKSNLQKRKANPGSKYWQNKADPLWGEVIHKMYDSCAVCGKSGTKLDAHHLITKRNKLTRHSIENGMLLCSYCHTGSHKLSAHGAPLEFANWLQTEKPEIWDWVQENKWKTGKPDYEAAYNRLKEWLDSNDPRETNTELLAEQGR